MVNRQVIVKRIVSPDGKVIAEARSISIVAENNPGNTNLSASVSISSHSVSSSSSSSSCIGYNFMT